MTAETPRAGDQQPAGAAPDNPFQVAFGHSRAVRAGDFVLVSGCTSATAAGVEHEGDPYLQARTAFDTGLKALERFGLGLEDVVRTRMYLVHPRDTDAVGQAHRDVFGQVRPAATMLVVAGLVDSRMLVEVELDAYPGGPQQEPAPEEPRS